MIFHTWSIWACDELVPMAYVGICHVCVCVLFFFNLLDPGETMNDFKLKDFQRLFFQDVLQ